jgi:hypothetical protein
MSCGYGIEFCKGEPNCPHTFKDRPVRLADVLLVDSSLTVTQDGYLGELICSDEYDYALNGRNGTSAPTP